MKKRVGILGGTFNPVHNMHLFMATKVQEAYNLDEMWLMPTYLPPHKSSRDVIDGRYRKKMLQLAIENNPKLRVEDIELRNQEVSYSYHTMKQLCEQYPDTTFYFIIGGDMLSSLDTWYRIEDLKEMVTFIGVERVGYHHDRMDGVEYVTLPVTEISSSYIRDSLHHHQSVRYLLPDSVLHYIEKEGLYQ